MDKKIFVGCFVLFFLVLLISQDVFGLGVTPARKTLDFEPGSKHEVEFSLMNNEGKDIEIAIYAEGDLAESIVVSENVVKLLSTEESKTISYTFTMPSKLEPGLRETEIIARELPKTTAFSGTEIGSTVAVVHQLHVLVPYPGKYATAELKIAETGRTDVVNFIVPVNSFGTQDIVSAKGIIDIYGPTNEKIATINTNERGILSGERVELTAEWSGDFNSGKYYAKLTVVYDGEVTSEFEKVFNVGAADLKVLDILVNDDFSLGAIAKFNILVESSWSEDCL